MGELYSDDRDARRFIVEGWIYVGLIHLILALVLCGILPRWCLPLLLPVLMARLMIGRHELIHLRKETTVDWLNSLWPVLAMITPLSTGYREHRRSHRLHHKFLLSDRDPDRYQIHGSKLRGFFNVFTSPEQNVVRWIADHGADAELVGPMVARACIFFALWWIAGPLFIWYWLPLRLTYGVALFLFSYVLHRRGRLYGTFAIALPPIGVRAFVLLFGRAGWLAVCNHDLHHSDARLAARALDRARAV
jgi:fatty acid desaturase